MYGLGGLLNRLIGLALIPILLRALSPEEWGVYVLLLLAGEVVAVVPGALADSLSRIYFDARAGDDRDAVVSTALVLAVGLAAGILAGLPASGLLAGRLVGDPALTTAAALAVAAWSCEAILEVELVGLRLRTESGWVVAAALSRSLLQFTLCILLVVSLDLGVEGLLLGYLLAVACVSLFLLVRMLRARGVRFRPSLARALVLPALPLVPAGLARSLLGLAPAYALNLLGSTGAVGLYGLAARLADQLRVALMAPFAEIWGVRLLEVADQPERARELYRVLLHFTLLLLAGVLALSLFAPELVRILAAREFSGAAPIVPLIGFAYALVPLQYSRRIPVLRSGRMGLLLVTNALALAALVGLLWVLIPRLGIAGAALAELAVGLLLLGLLSLAARRVGAAPGFPWREVTVFFALAIGVWATALGIVGLDLSPLAFAVKSAALVAFAALALGLPVLPPSERRQITRRLGGWLRRPTRAE